jgi:hypothetical protein
MAKIAVLTGDLINSTGVSSPKAFRLRLQSLLDSVDTLYGGSSVTFRGDGFQVAFDDPRRSIESALYIRAGLIGSSPAKTDRWDARISVAIGAAATNEDSYGDAYIQSGRNLDEMNRDKLQVYAEPSAFRIGVALASAFVDDIISGWTPSEAEAYFTHLQHPQGHEAVAKHLKKSRSTVTKSLIRAKYSLINRYLEDTRALMEITHAV